MSINVWSHNWKQRVQNCLQERGFPNWRSFISAHPETSFAELSRVLGPRIAPLQVQRLYLLECVEAGEFCEAVAECLARSIIKQLPGGWGTGENVDFRQAAAIAHWIFDVLDNVQQSEVDEVTLTAIGDALVKEIQPPLGWKPTTGADPLIQRAFAIAQVFPPP